MAKAKKAKSPKVNIARRAGAARAKAKRLVSSTIATPKKGDIKGKKISKKGSRYHEGWHTTHDGKKVYLRSGSEFKYAKELDRKKIVYEVESLSFFYYDSKLKRMKRAFPDFYIPSQNLVVEIKGGHLVNLQNLKDRKRAIEVRGYKFKVIVDGKELSLND